MKVFSLNEIKELGFVHTKDGGESYYTLLLEPEDPFWGDYLVAEWFDKGCYAIHHNTDENPLNELEVLEIIDKYKK